MLSFRRLIVLIAAITFLATYIFAADIKEEDDVLVLTDANFDTAIAENDILLVEFYAPWCGHCKKLTPEYAKAAAALKKEDPPVRIAKLDATEHKTAAQAHEIRGFPTLKFFRNGAPSDYQGGRTAEDIISFMKKKSGPVAKTVSSVADVDTFLTGNPTACIGVFESTDSSVSKKFLDMASKVDDFPFAISTAGDVKSKYGVKAKNALVLVTADGTYDMPMDDSTTSEAAQAWLSGYSVPSLIKFSPASAKTIFGGAIQTHLLLLVEDEKKESAIVDAVKSVHADYRTDLLTVLVENDDRIFEVFGAQKSDLPSIVIADLSGGSALKKYKFDKTDFSEANVKAFIDDFKAGKLTPDLKSEEPSPEDWSAPVKVLKGKSFKEKVLDSKESVLVEFYAPWCGHCKALEPKYNELAQNLEDNDDITIAKMDATANEIDVPGVDIRGFPTLMFFPAGSKGSPKPYEGQREVKAMESFVLKEIGAPSDLTDEL